MIIPPSRWTCPVCSKEIRGYDTIMHHPECIAWKPIISWIDIDKQLEKEGWNLLLIRSHEQWRCHYDHVAHLPCSAVGLNQDEVIAEAQAKVLEGE